MEDGMSGPRRLIHAGSNEHSRKRQPASHLAKTVLVDSAIAAGLVLSLGCGAKKQPAPPPEPAYVVEARNYAAADPESTSIYNERAESGYYGCLAEFALCGKIDTSRSNPAILSCKSVLNWRPDDIRAPARLAYLYYELGKRKTAKQWYDSLKKAEKYPGQYDYLFAVRECELGARVRLYNRLGNLDRAAKTAKLYLERVRNSGYDGIVISGNRARAEATICTHGLNEFNRDKTMTGHDDVEPHWASLVASVDTLNAQCPDCEETKNANDIVRLLKPQIKRYRNESARRLDAHMRSAIANLRKYTSPPEPSAWEKIKQGIKTVADSLSPNLTLTRDVDAHWSQGYEEAKKEGATFYYVIESKMVEGRHPAYAYVKGKYWADDRFGDRIIQYGKKGICHFKEKYWFNWKNREWEWLGFTEDPRWE